MSTTGRFRKVASAGYEVSRELATLLTGAFGIVAALAWSDAVKGAFTRLGAFKEWPFVGPFLYAIMVTVAAYAATLLMSRFVKAQCTRVCTDSSLTAPAGPGEAT